MIAKWAGAAYGAGHAGLRSDSPDGGLRADLLPVEEVVCGPAIGSGTGVEATPGGKRPAEKAGRGAEPGQGDASGHRGKKVTRPALKRAAAAYTVARYPISQRRACRLLRQHRSVQYYRSRRDPRTALRVRMREIAATRPRFGYRRIQVLLRREGSAVGKNLIYRLYKEEALELYRKLPRCRKMVVTRRERYVPTRANSAWSMDFVADQLADGQRLRALTVVLTR